MSNTVESMPKSSKEKSLRNMAQAAVYRRILNDNPDMSEAEIIERYAAKFAEIYDTNYELQDVIENSQDDDAAYTAALVALQQLLENDDD